MSLNAPSAPSNQERSSQRDLDQCAAQRTAERAECVSVTRVERGSQRHSDQCVTQRTAERARERVRDSSSRLID